MVSAIVLGAGAVTLIVALLTLLGLGDYCVLYIFEETCFFTLQNFLVLLPLIYLGGHIIQWFELWNPLKLF